VVATGRDSRPVGADLWLTDRAPGIVEIASFIDGSPRRRVILYDTRPNGGASTPDIALNGSKVQYLGKSPGRAVVRVAIGEAVNALKRPAH